MKKLHFFTAAVAFSALFSVNTVSAAVGFNPTVEDIDSSATGYNYAIQTDCFGSCWDTMGGVPITELYQTDTFYLPYFSDAGITAINSPLDWSYTIEASNDIFNLGNSAGVIHWSASPGNELALWDNLSGFTYTSSFSSSVTAPFRLDYVGGAQLFGDLSIPASPLALAAGLIPIAAVPEPASIWLFGSALLGLAGFRKLRGSK
ncbi:MAG: hypothetical protein ACJA0N_000717 [Pseudohongiellaceae bacterium]|jgi:hypothetical protein